MTLLYFLLHLKDHSNSIVRETFLVLIFWSSPCVTFDVKFLLMHKRLEIWNIIIKSIEVLLLFSYFQKLLNQSLYEKKLKWHFVLWSRGGQLFSSAGRFEEIFVPSGQLFISKTFEFKWHIKRSLSKKNTSRDRQKVSAGWMRTDFTHPCYRVSRFTWMATDPL
jgi:hypothetical protein